MFTEAKTFAPILSGPSVGHWRAGQTYSFFEAGSKKGRAVIVSAGDISNGANVPDAWLVVLVTFIVLWPFLGSSTAFKSSLILAALIAWLLPRIHAEYIAAVFVHDIGLKKHRHLFSRFEIDRLFLKAMRVECWPLQPLPELEEYRAVLRWFVRVMPAWIIRIVRPYLMFAAVVLFGLLKERLSYFKKGNVT